MTEEPLESASCVGCGDPLKVPYGTPSICTLCLNMVEQRGDMLKEGSAAVARALEMAETNFCNLCRPAAIDICKVLADEIHHLRGAKPKLMDCTHCDKKVPTSKVWTCDTCGQSGFCVDCLESWNHQCKEDDR